MYYVQLHFNCNSQDFPSVKTVQLYRVSTQTDLAIIYINKELLKLSCNTSIPVLPKKKSFPQVGH